MKKPKLAIVSGLVVISLIAWAGAQTTGALRAKPSATAAVNLEKLFEGLEEKVQFDQDQVAAREALQKEAEAKNANIEALDADLKFLKRGEADHQAKLQELELAALDLQVWSKYQQNKLIREAGLRIEQIYKKILLAIGRVAQESGYDLVLYRETDPPKFQYENIPQLLAQLGSRKVLYNSDAIDITDQVLQQMNNEYQNAP